MSSVRAVAVQHEDDAPPGLLGEWARRRGIALDVLRPDRGERLPDSGLAADFVVVLGAAASVTDPTVPWLAPELEWLGRLDARGVPMFGICFGAQALAAALGGAVCRAPAPELGWIDVAPRAGQAGHAAVDPGPWFAWHEDTIELPNGAVVLADNDAGVQAYSLGRHLAVQFHPEVTPAITTCWIEQAPSDFPSSQIDVAALQTETAREAAGAARRADALFDDFAARVAAVAERV